MPSAGAAATLIRHEVEPSADGLRDARRVVVEMLKRWSVDTRTANAALDVANELISNAVQHGGPPISVCLDLDVAAGAVTVVVTDCSRVPALLLPYRAGVSERGLGIRLVAQLSAAWGQRPDGDGKAVWATIHPQRRGGGR